MGMRRMLVWAGAVVFVVVVGAAMLSLLLDPPECVNPDRWLCDD